MDWPIYYSSIFILGLAVGSFVNSLVWRAQKKAKIKEARSICPNCRVKIIWADNIPLLSFVILRRKCRHCGQKISWQYFLAEFFMGGLFLLSALLHSQNLVAPTLTFGLARDLIILAFLAFIFLYDFNYMEILPSATIIPGAILLLISSALNPQSWISALLGVVFGAGFFYFLFIVSRGRWIGGGDAMLGFFMGAIFGWPLILVAFFLSYMIGAVVSLLLMGFGQKTLKSRFPFGAFLAVGAVIAMFWGQRLLDLVF